jgi:hypothetical protein
VKEEYLTEILNLSNSVGIKSQRRLGDGLEQVQSGGRACGFGHGEGQRVLRRETRPLGEHRFSNNVQYQCGEGSVMLVYLSPEHAGRSTAALAGWGVGDIERVLEGLTPRGVTFER